MPGVIQLRCDRCDRTIEVTDPLVGQKVTCPHCGNVTVIRSAAPEASARPDRAAAAGYPPAHGPEADVLSLRPSMARARPWSFVLLLIALLGGLIGGAVLLGTELGAPAAVASAGLGVLAGMVLGVWKLRTLGEGITVTSKRIVDREGFFSRKTSEIRHADIQNVQVHQTFWQRVCGVGTIAVSTAGDTKEEVMMHNVPRPDRVAMVIDLYRPL